MILHVNHKRRIIKTHVASKHWPELQCRVSKAYHETNYARAKAALERTAR